MKINPAIRQKVEEINERNLDRYLEYPSIVHCLLLWEFGTQVPELRERILSEGVVKVEDWDFLSVEFLTIDTVTGETVLKIPLFDVPRKEGSYIALCKLIERAHCMDNRGHLNNPQDYEVFLGAKDRESQDLFDRLCIEDLEKARDVIIEFYQHTKPAKKLSNFLRGGFMVNYEQ